MASVVSNKIQRDELMPGDHIYYWIRINLYSHHGIYVGNRMVIHYNRWPGEDYGSSTKLDPKLARSCPDRVPNTTCQICKDQKDYKHGITKSCLDCFLNGAHLRRYRYGVSKFVFFAQARGGTCTMARSDAAELTIDRADHLLKHGFGNYKLLKNNCEDFAIYCKTGKVIMANVSVSRSGQVISIRALSVASSLAFVPALTPAVVGVALKKAINKVAPPVVMKMATVAPTRNILMVCGGLGLVWGCIVYCRERYYNDINVRKDVCTVGVKNLPLTFSPQRH